MTKKTFKENFMESFSEGLGIAVAMILALGGMGVLVIGVVYAIDLIVF